MSPQAHAWLEAAAVAASSGAFTWLLVGALRRYAIRHAVLDHPTERSSHLAATPRGGGLAIAMAGLGAAAWAAANGLIASSALVGFAGGGLLVAGIGWMDDHRALPVVPRALAQIMAVVWTLAWLGGATGAGVPAIERWSSEIAVALAVVWLINLYNFMDGTDGIAGIQGACASLMGAWLLHVAGAGGWALVCVALGGACVGFLGWNWPPARIFMGDSGSCFLGYSFGVIALAGEKEAALPALTWAILLAPFIADASFTLARRVFAGELWYVAHRSHAYQRFVQLGNSHARLAVLTLALNVLLLWPTAALVFVKRDLLGWALAASALIMLALWCWTQHAHARRSSSRDP
jgi:Fuc2NAc and GlcNAc transferase